MNWKGFAESTATGVQGRRQLRARSLPGMAGSSKKMSGDAELGCASRDLHEHLNVKALAAAALALGLRIAEAKCLVQALLHEVHFGAIDVVEAVAVDDDLDAVVLEHHVVGAHVVGIVHDIREP